MKVPQPEAKTTLAPAVRPPGKVSPAGPQAELSEQKGRALEGDTREFFESRFAHDFSRVRIHTDNEAAASASNNRAAAYTIGSHIAFDQGRYSPDTPAGRHVLSHELAHVIQQERGGSTPPESAETERGAENAAKSLGLGLGNVAVTGAAAPGIARIPGDTAAPPGGGPRDAAQALVQQLKAANKEVVVNVGGTGASHEPPDAINVNPNKVAARKNIPNHVEATGEEIGTLFEPGQVSKVVGHRLAPQVLEWDQVAEGAFQVLEDGGTFNVNFRWSDPEAAAKLVAALKKAGFENVRNVADVMITATKGSGTPGAGGPPPGTGGGVPPAGAGGALEKTKTEPLVEGDTAAVDAARLAPKVEGSGTGVVEGAMGDAAAGGGLAAEVGGIVLGMAAELLIGVAIGLLVEWLMDMLEQSQIESSLQALNPQILATLQGLSAKILETQKKDKVYSRVTVAMKFEDGISATPGSPLIGVSHHFYQGATLLSVDVSDEDQGAQRTKKTEGAGSGESTTTYIQSCSTLIDEPGKRRREKQNAAILAHLKKVVPKKKDEPPQDSETKQPPLLPTPGPVQKAPEFVSLPGAPGQSPLVEVNQRVAEFKAKALELKSQGEKILSTSGSKPEDIASFKHEEDIWRSAATWWLNHYKNEGPDLGRAGMDEALNSDQYGGRLKQIRQSLGG